MLVKRNQLEIKTLISLINLTCTTSLQQSFIKSTSVKLIYNILASMGLTNPNAQISSHTQVYTHIKIVKYQNLAIMQKLTNIYQAMCE